MSRIMIGELSTKELINRYFLERDPKLQKTIVERHEGLVRSLAHKFARPGVPVEDLIQSAWVGFIGALDRFDPRHETKFSTYAVHCMIGEIKRYFRDRTWCLKVPRYLQEIAANLTRKEDELFRKLQRPPSLVEMAEAFEISEEDMVAAMAVHRVYLTQRLEERHRTGDGDESSPLGEMLGAPDQDMVDVIEHAPLKEALATLDERKRKIVRRRFFEGYSQSEVAQQLGLSQMHISRLERSALKELRSKMVAA